MDWRKFFGSESDDKDRKRSDKFNFKKFDDQDDDDEWFDLETFFNDFQDNKFRFHGFPNSILKQFKTIIDAMEDIEVDDQHIKEKNLQKFYDNYSQFKQKSDQDLDGKIYVDQLDTLLKRINPELMLKDDKKKIDSDLKNVQIIRKLTDEEKIMDIIHGTYKEPVIPVKPRKRHIHKAPLSPHHFSALPPFHEFPPPSNNNQHQGHSRSWGKTVISIRNSDGSSETRKVERTSDGNTRTTITKMDAGGNSSTKSFVGDEKITNFNQSTHVVTSSKYDERNLISYDGYKIPCLW
ncbi:unnamed protein product [Chironomus riparius]|uniref:Uncharacterized protein n=1 Tax=Chironomus riparius TaxID=315576 RepID=A0A9N9RI92_9DIPT|nr:unnamed protein product [Chironomus riparius]